MGQCPSDCSGHGTCMTEPQLYCQCYFGYVGMDCNAKICPNDCSGHGYCASDGNCTCLPGYSGYDCSSGACPANCNENGVCIHSRCECNIGYQGKFLSTKEYSFVCFFSFFLFSYHISIFFQSFYSSPDHCRRCLSRPSLWPRMRAWGMCTR